MMLTILPIRYVADIEVSRAFYTGLGLAMQSDSSFDIWVQLRAEAGMLGLHDAAASQGRPPGTVELALVTDEKLEHLARRLDQAGYEPLIVAENFGRSVRVVDPDGVTVQIQEIDIGKARGSS